MDMPASSDQERKRVEALRGYHILDTLPEESFDRLTRLAALICRTPISLISLVDEERQWFKSRIGLEWNQTPRAQSFCQHALEADCLFQVPDARLDDRFQSNPLVWGEESLRFYAGYPLIDPDGYPLGALCVLDRVARQLDAGQVLALELLAKETMGQIVANKRYRELHALEQLFLMSPDLIGLISPTGKIWKINPTFERSLGWKDGELLGKSPLDFVHPDDRETTLGVRRSLNDGRTGVQSTSRFRTRSGEYRTLDWVINVDPATAMRYIVARDVTQQKALEAEMALAHEQAQAASKAKSEFLATMSHEIRTPLNGVIGFTDILLKTPLDETQKQFLGVIHQSANSLLDIVSDILDFSKIEEGKIELELQENNLHETAGQVVDAVSFQGNQKNLEMLLDLDPNLPTRAVFDSVRLRQVLVNLLGNAVKFTQKGEIELSIRVLENGRIGFSVRDTGVGIKPQYQQKIFQAFTQEDASTTRRFGGTGLGLAISNRLLALMGSRLNLQSTPDVGTTFSFDLDLEVLEDPHPLTHRSASGQAFSPARLLVVDDNAGARRILSRLLATLGLESVEASTADEAAALLESHRFEAVLWDQPLQLPPLPSDLPVILLVSVLDKDTSDPAAAFQLVKPVKSRALETVLHRILDVGSVQLSKASGAVDLVSKTASDKTFKVLIADDNTLNVFLARTVLGLLFPGCIIIEAPNGRVALEKFLSEKPDLVLMDVQMPVMNGLEATRQIRALEASAALEPNESTVGVDKNSRVIIIALTAGAVKSEKEACLDSGMDDYLSKPFVKEDLQAVLERNLYSVGKS